MDKKEFWKMVINVVVAALSAIATALGVTSCMWFDISGVICIHIFVRTRRSDTPCFILYLLTDRQTDRQNILHKQMWGGCHTPTILLASIKWSVIILLTSIIWWLDKPICPPWPVKRKNWKVRKDFLREGGWKRKTGDASRRYRFSADKLI